LGCLSFWVPAALPPLPDFFYLLGQNESARHQGFGPIAQNAWDAALAAGLSSSIYIVAILQKETSETTMVSEVSFW
jgi:hypothetical protein